MATQYEGSSIEETYQINGGKVNITELSEFKVWIVNKNNDLDILVKLSKNNETGYTKLTKVDDFNYKANIVLRQGSWVSKVFFSITEGEALIPFRAKSTLIDNVLAF